MISTLSTLPRSRLWWASLALLCLLLEGVALYYQYQLNYLPCVLCIHMRMLLAALIIVCLLALLTPLSRIWSVCLWLVATLFCLWMLERSWQILGVEMGFIMGDCQMSSGLPDWFALERWFPSVFKIHEPCGYTPYLFLTVSMAHVLLVLTSVLSVLGIVVLSLQFRQKA